MDDSSEDALHTSMLSELRKKGSAIDLQPTLILERDSLGTHATLAFLALFLFFSLLWALYVHC